MLCYDTYIIYFMDRDEFGLFEKCPFTMLSWGKFFLSMHNFSDITYM